MLEFLPSNDVPGVAARVSAEFKCLFDDDDRFEVISRALRDASFQDRLIQDPRSTINEALKLCLDPSITISVHRESPEEFHVVLRAIDTLPACEDGRRGRLYERRAWDTIAEHFGLREIPENKVRVHFETQKQIHMVLPVLEEESPTFTEQQVREALAGTNPAIYAGGGYPIPLTAGCSAGCTALCSCGGICSTVRPCMTSVAGGTCF
jgi:hypothetical protein